MINICIIYENTSDMEYLTNILQSIPIVKLMGCYMLSYKAIRTAADTLPDIVIICASQREYCALEAASLLRLALPAIGLIAVFSDDHYAMEAFDSEINSYLLMPVSREKLFKALLKISSI